MKESMSGEGKTKCELNVVKCMSLFLLFSVLLWVSIVLTDPASDGHYFKLERGIPEESDVEEEQFLPSGFDEESCVSRYELPQYRRGVARKPSPDLIAKLRSYEARHKRCGPHTTSYNQTVVLLQSDTPFSDNSTALDLDCKYIVWRSFNGLGNKMLSLASAFLYALLTDRVLLADRDFDIPDLFCEPFPEASWFLPTDFPLKILYQESNQSYGNVVTASSPPQPCPYIYLKMFYNANQQDQLFICDPDHSFLHNTPWLIMMTDQYLAPFFFLMPSFQHQLHTLFPEKETVFLLLGRYLFHPTNSVWGLITRYYQAYLSKADVITGIQIRTLDNNTGSFMDQILSCVVRENILPQIDLNLNQERPIKSNTSSRVVVLMTSLTSAYFDIVRDLYWRHRTTRGEVVGVYQPSHEEVQQTEKHDDHNRKALAEIYLLSFTDKLVTSGWSTFGYVGRALGGMNPAWILYRPQNQTHAADPPCQRATSMEPCFMFPPRHNCKMRRGMDHDHEGGVVRECEDVTWGLKLH